MGLFSQINRTGLEALALNIRLVRELLRAVFTLEDEQIVWMDKSPQTDKTCESVCL